MAEVALPSSSSSNFLENAPTSSLSSTSTNKPSRVAVAKKNANAIVKRRQPKASRGKGTPDGPKPKQTKSRDGAVLNNRKLPATRDRSAYPPTPPLDDVNEDHELPQDNALLCGSNCDQTSVALSDLTTKLDQLSAPHENFIILPPENSACYSTTPSPPNHDFDGLSLFDQEEPITPTLSAIEIPDAAQYLSPDVSPASRPSILANLSQKENDHGAGPADLPPHGASPMDTEQGLEEVCQQPESNEVVSMRHSSPFVFESASTTESPFHAPSMEVDLRPEDSGLLQKLFYEQTCGILSIKNGPNENPWKTLLWPIVHQEPALYYAMLSMTASHAASQAPELRVKGLELMTTSIELLRGNLASMRSDTALATALILAFSESWHSHIYTGISHLRGARSLISQGLQSQEQASMDSEDMARLRFLRSTWVYMDVIARLTALGGDDPEDLDMIVMPTYGPETSVHDIDPLMGCATSLFPLIGAVANLAKKVRKTQKTPLQVVAKAAALRDQLHKWQVPSQLVPPSDESLEVDHSRHTAEAYRWATILFLYQAVPMVCTEEPLELAEITLGHLAAVPITSRATIIHIFPLLAAGCEAESEEDRSFVAERWDAMMSRMCIGNLDRCWDVVQEVWQRRDERDTAQQGSPSLMHPTISRHNSCSNEDIDQRPEGLSSLKRYRRSFSSGDRIREQGAAATIKTDPQKSVRGRLHWVAVMTEKHWESRLNLCYRLCILLINAVEVLLG
ncbi:uncharacterized protein KY384_006454 [Bacidia gigantensis]|uniref:uncharacterized protein n=1 Tax=Bacidia gigantensis TaxID=2732470 RepID=UPI001D054DD4|nr:uncharacterized protein KY384_006454 [Bacidia gigantensis]KAG8528766.1 hypothetical protein KY384_006454 [Bacidia gigantensis]